MTTREHITEQSPLAAFLQWYRDEPDAIAVECLAGPHRRVTVREVYARAARLANSLLKVEGSKQDDVVGIQIELEPELYIAFFACWMAGRSVLYPTLQAK
jgi:acyl-CoA synthetase (AMP-forming)/AMP-acid ligase II